MTIFSPCTKVCKLLDSSVSPTKICIGCGRTIEEITKWSKMDPIERIQVVELLPSRLASLNSKP